MTVLKTPNLIASVIARALLVLTLSALCGPASAHVIPLTDRQVAAGSPHVVVAVVDGARTRWNDRHNLIFTDYTLRVESRLKGDAPERITLSIPGGTLDGQTHAACVSTPLESGVRYLLFLQDLDRRLLVPFTGGWQGVYREVSGPRGKRLASHGPSEAGSPAPATSSFEFSQVVRSARELIARVEADPRPSDTDWTREIENADLPAKRYDPTPRAIPAGVDPSGIEQDRAHATAKDLRFFVDHPAVVPLVFDPLPSDSPFSPGDRDMLAYWNRYVRRPIFQVARRPSPGWAFGNGVSEIVGFPSSDELEAQFGIGWFPGGYSSIISGYDDEGRTVEADIAMNPARQWTADPWEPSILFGTDRFSFNPILLQQLGAAWGYKGPYPFDNRPENPAELTLDTIMEPKVADNYAVLMPSDTEAARATFGGKPIRDGLISPYSIFVSEDGFLSSFYAYPAVETAAAGSSFEIENAIKIDNPGTVGLGQPTIEVLLVPKRGSLARGVLVKRIRLDGNLLPGETRRVVLGTAAIPRNTRPGTYYLAYVLKDSKDAYQGNNQAWALAETPLMVTR